VNLSGTWTNTGIITATNATLNLGGSSVQMGTILALNSTINVDGSFPATQLAAIQYYSPGRVYLSDGAVVDNTSNILALTSNTGSWYMNGGTLRGGVVTTSGGAQLFVYDYNQNVLDGATIDGVLDVENSQYSGFLTVVNGLTVNGTMYVGNPTNSAAYGYVTFHGTQTLSGTGTVIFGNNSNNHLFLDTAGTTLTIGSNLTVKGTSGIIGYNPNNGPQNVTVVNQGTISADVAGGTVYIANLASNTGVIAETNSQVYLYGSFALAGGTFRGRSGAFNLAGTLDVGGATLDLDETGPWRLIGGTIRNATMQSTNNIPLAVEAPGGTLDGVAMNALLSVGADAFYPFVRLNILHGLVLNGVMTVGRQTLHTGNPDQYGLIDFMGNQTLSGKGEVYLNNPSSSIFAEADSILTIGPGVVVHGFNGEVGLPNTGAVINQGNIVSDVQGQAIVVQGTFTNLGTVQVAGGSLLSFNSPTWANLGSMIANGGTLDFRTQTNAWRNDGLIAITNATFNLTGNLTRSSLGTFQNSGGSVSFSGTLDNSEGTINLDGWGVWFLNGGTIRNGTISSATGVPLIGTSAGGALDGVTLDAPLVLTNSSGVLVTNGLVLNSLMEIGDGRVFCAGSQAISGSGQILLGQYSSGLFAGPPGAGGGASLTPGLGLGSTLTLGAGITVHGLGGVIDPNGGTILNQASINCDVPSGQIILCYDGGNFTNLGTLSATAPRAAISTAANAGIRTSLGSVLVQSGATVDFGGDVRFDGASLLTMEPGSTFGTRGNLLGNSVNADDFMPFGTVVFDGTDTFTNPQLFEVMSQDLGNNAAGFAANFAYGAVALASNTYVRLVDQSRNSPGTNAEALYVNSLVVPTGATLDLNGFHLYTRGSQVNGLVLGGSVSHVAAGGAVAFGSPADGTISTVGQFDGWTLFGRAGQNVAIVLDPGTTNVLSPGLGFAEIRVLDPTANVLAVGTNPVVNQVIALTNMNLLVDGVYRVQVLASPNASANLGNYELTIWDATPNVLTLALNEQQNGRIQNPYKVNQWNFSASAGQQVSFELLNSSGPGVAFDLRGPNGWLGFSNLTGNSSLVDLPTSGSYTLAAYGTGGAYNVDYAFELLQTAVTNLAVGGSFTGSFVGNGQAQLFTISNPANQPLRITLQNAGANNLAELYVGFGVPPTRGSFTQSVANGPGANRQIMVNNAYAGTWYVLVYSDSISTPGTFTLGADSGPLFLTSLTPAQGGSGETTTVQIQGAGFLSSARVILQGNGIAPLTASNITWISPSQLVVDLNLSSIPNNTYQLTVNQGTNTASLSFAVIGAAGPKFQAQLITPTGIGLDTVNTFYVEYSNTGDTPMVAPLLMVTALHNTLVTFCQDYMTAQFSLDSSQLSRVFWATSGPSGASDKVTFFASGKIPGVLLPGESGRVPVYFLGMKSFLGDSSCFTGVGGHIVGWRIVNVPVSSLSGGGFSFQLFEFLPPQLAGRGNGQTQADQPMNWQGLLTNVPPSIPADAWPVIWMNFTNDAGNTLYSYFGMLQREVNFLYRLGTLASSVNSVGDLSTFAILRADGLHVVKTLASAVDASPPTRGLKLSFQRTFPNSISGRYRLGGFGRGWSHNWDYHLAQATNGNVSITTPGGGLRNFTPDLRGGYTANLGDYGQLTALGGGAFSLREKNGLVSSFDATGNLSFIQDPNGNTITCGYTGGVLTILSHSSGPKLTLTYTGQGRIASVTDQIGRTTSFTYDASGEHLASALYYDGRQFAYQYSVGNGAALEHALTQIQNPDQTHQFFAYDARGRVQNTSRAGGVETVTYSFDNAGTVYATDALANVSKFFFDNRGLLVRMENPNGEVAQIGFDNRFNLTSLTDAAGRSFGYAYDPQGNVTEITDPLGNKTDFGYEPIFQRISLLSDAKGNATRYGYDSRANLTSITYPDGAAERWGYDTCCTPTTWANRRQQQINYQYDPATGLILSKLYPDGSRATYSYDARNNLVFASNYAGVITLDYYPTNDRLHRITYPGGQWLQYNYDVAGRRTGMTDQRGYQLLYSYDGTGRLSSITNSDNVRVVYYQYDNAGRLEQKVLASGVYTTYAYDPAGRVQSLTNTLPNQTVVSFFNYAYDQRGRRITMATTDGQWAYEYDDLGQLTHAVLNSVNPQVPDQDLTYVYDARGNRVHTVLNGVAMDWSVNILNQYTAAGGTNYSFDADGNLIREGSSQEDTTFTYDFENRLVGLVDSTNSSEYAYDALGNRVTRTQNGATTIFVTDLSGLGNTVAEYDSVGNLAAGYDYGLGLESRRDASDKVGTYTFDAIGNVQQIINASGTVANSYSYEPFGGAIRATESMPSSFKFGGQAGVMSERSGLNFMRKRFYDAHSGRFASEDPLGLSGQDPNLYRYVLNSPTILIDPTGALSVGPWIDSHPLGTAAIVGVGALLLPVGIAVGTYGIVVASATIATAATSVLVTCGFHPDICSDVIPNIVGKMGEDITETHLPFSPSVGISLVIDFISSLPELAKTAIEAIGKIEAIDWGAIFNDLKTSFKTTQELVPIYAYDPNQKIIMAGQGAQGFVQASTLLPYRIDFENETNATAPAQQVVITDQLTNTVDWSTFELTEIQFGDQFMVIPLQTKYFETNLSLTFNGVAFVLNIRAGIKSDTGQVFANFTSLDPQTQLPPPANVGFLPPEDGFGRGRGHIAYVVRAKPNLPTNTQIRNVALITFDVNSSITTDQVNPQDPSLGIDPTKQALVTLDSTPPVSAVNALPQAETNPSFQVCWSGSDVGSGVASYNIYVSTNTGPWTSWLAAATNTCAVFPGQDGQNYGFYSVAQDVVGNVEGKPPAPEATTTVHAGPPAPQFQSVARSDSTITLDWTAIAGRTYQLQFKTNLTQSSWNNSGSPTTATNSTAAASDAIGQDLERFYRVVLLP
jgi:RHS repeat-associated protein